MTPLVTPMLAGQPPPIQPPKLKMEESRPEDIAAAAYTVKQACGNWLHSPATCTSRHGRIGAAPSTRAPTPSIWSRLAFLCSYVWWTCACWAPLASP